jgi:DnaJ family protein B protein 4
MGKDYYKILGVGKNATDDEIKKAYKKLAFKWHPDKNLDNQQVAKEKFTEIGEAYEVLRDKNKRAVFDQYGEEGLKGGIPTGGGGPEGSAGPFPQGGGFHFTSANAEDVFAQFFGGMGGMGGMGGGRGGMPFGRKAGRGGSAGGHPFAQFMGGMGGMGGGMDDEDMGQSRGFGGPKSKDPAVHQPLRLSYEDLYTGLTKRLKISRQLYNESTGQTSKEDKIVEIPVKPGWKAGTKITFEGHGDEHPGRLPADLIFTVEEKPHAVFKRQGNNLVATKTISLTDALCGTTFQVQSLDGKTIDVDCSRDVISPTFKKVLRGHGMPVQNKPNEFGDLIVEFKIRFPSSLTTAQKQKVREANL